MMKAQNHLHEVNNNLTPSNSKIKESSTTPDLSIETTHDVVVDVIIPMEKVTPASAFNFLIQVLIF